KKRIGMGFVPAKRIRPSLLLSLLLIVTTFNTPVHAVGETYTITESASRLQESSAASVLLILNVSNANSVANYAFTWSVKDPSGSVHKATNATNVPHAASFVESVAYPSEFGSSSSLAYTGVYVVWVNQTQPLFV